MALFARAARPLFRPLTTADALACATLHGGAFAHGWSEIEFERLLAADASYADAAFDGRMLMGFILSRVAADEAEVLTIVVAPRWRGKGLGNNLLVRHLARLAAARVATLFLEVNADNVPARALYARAGFKDVGRRKGYYPPTAGETAVDALILSRSLL